MSLRPALIIGIGGTGKAAVYDIRSRIIDKFGSLDAVPVIKFLVLDTDICQSDLVEEDCSFYKAGILSEDEFVYLDVPAERLARIKKGLQYDFPYYQNWLNLDALDTPCVRVTSGIRQRGRLAFYENYNAIATAVSTGMKDVISEISVNRTVQDGRIVDNKRILIYVIGSLIGGTCSGMFIDTGYLIQKIIASDFLDSRAVDITGVFLLPPAHMLGCSGNRGVSSYAALLELNHYSDHSTTFKMTAPNGEKIEANSPPYHYTYLINNQNEYTTLDIKKLLQMVGQKIFLDTTSSFSYKMLSSRDCMEHQLCGSDLKGCNQSYLTFGISTIEIPVYSLIKSCSAMFLKDVFTELRYGTYKKSNIEIDKKYMSQTLLTNSMSEGEIIKALKRYKGTDLITFINDRIEEVDTYYISNLLKELINMEQEFEDKFKPKDSNVVGSIEGEFAQKIRENCESFMKQKSERNIGEIINGLCNKPECRIRFASVFLDSIEEYYNHLYKKYLVENSKLKMTIERSRRAFLRCKRGAAILVNDRVLLFWKDIVIKDFLNRIYKEKAKKYFGLLTKYLVNIYMLDIIKNINKIIDKQRARLNSLELYVDEIITEFEILRKLAQASFVAINGLQLLPKEKGSHENFINRTYRESIGDKEDKRNSLKNFIFGEINKFIQKDNGGTDIFLLKKSPLEKDEMKDNLYNKAKEKVAAQGQLEQLDVIKMFYEQYSQELESRFMEVYSLSSPFLLLNTSDPKYKSHPGKVQNRIAFHNAQKSEHIFKELCHKRICCFDKSNGFGNIEEKYRIIFYQEYGVFPLRIWRGVNILKERYKRHIRWGLLLSLVHNEKKYFDFIPIDKPAPEEIKELEKLLLIASVPGIDIFKITETKEYGMLYQLEYCDEEGTIKTLKLKGAFEKFSYQLFDKEQDIKAIENKIFKGKNDIGDEKFAVNIRNYLNGGLRDIYCNKEKMPLFNKYQNYIMEYIKDNDLGVYLENNDVKTELKLKQPIKFGSLKSDVPPKLVLRQSQIEG